MFEIFEICFLIVSSYLKACRNSITLFYYILIDRIDKYYHVWFLYDGVCLMDSKLLISTRHLWRETHISS